MQLSRTGNGHVDSSDSFVASLKGGGEGCGVVTGSPEPPCLRPWHMAHPSIMT